MNIQMTGIDHSLAPVEIRELFSFTRKGAREAMEALRQREGILGCVILSTCNRMEIWVHMREGCELSLYALLCELKDREPAEYERYFVHRRDEEAVRHLFQMTSGLKSRILGEDQVLTQVKEALQNAREVYSTDPVLETLFRMAITGAKKVKTGMQMSTANLSAVEQAVAGMKRRGYSFAGKRCLVIGNGEMGKRAAQALAAEGADVTVTVRQYRSGVVEIPVGCHRINYGDRLGLLPDCDLLVSATSSPNTTIRYQDVRDLPVKRQQIYIDLAVPRDIEPEVGTLPQVTLYDIDSFSVTQSEELTEQIRRAEEILEEQIHEFTVWYEGRDLVPRVRRMGRAAADDVCWRMGRTVKSLPLTEEETDSLRQAVCASSEKVIEKILFTIRNEAGVDVLRKCLEAAETEFTEEET
ncbi:MAG: glutamyl-tRNA reductase [Lachnospiraceae bacterium]|nr:glutamyl-tRNA reductase [Lachnospiraceae bacterium]